MNPPELSDVEWEALLSAALYVRRTVMQDWQPDPPMLQRLTARILPYVLWAQCQRPSGDRA